MRCPCHPLCFSIWGSGKSVVTSLQSFHCGDVGRGCGVGRGLGVTLGVAVGVAVAVGVGAGVNVGVAVGVGVGVGVAVGAAVGVAVAVGVDVGVGVAQGVLINCSLSLSAKPLALSPPGATMLSLPAAVPYTQSRVMFIFGPLLQVALTGS
jgi:hypothetical protein